MYGIVRLRGGVVCVCVRAAVDLFGRGEQKRLWSSDQRQLSRIIITRLLHETWAGTRLIIGAGNARPSQVHVYCTAASARGGRTNDTTFGPSSHFGKIDSSMSRPCWPEIDAERRLNVNNAIIPHAIRGKRRFFSSRTRSHLIFFEWHHSTDNESKQK